MRAIQKAMQLASQFRHLRAAFSGDPGIMEWPLWTAAEPSSKIAEHGGFNKDDVHVALVVSNPAFDAERVFAPVTTAQIAPTILKVLGLDPNELEAVRNENTPVLPDFN